VQKKTQRAKLAKKIQALQAEKERLEKEEEERRRREEEEETKRIEEEIRLEKEKEAKTAARREKRKLQAAEKKKKHEEIRLQAIRAQYANAGVIIRPPSDGAPSKGKWKTNRKQNQKPNPSTQSQKTDKPSEEVSVTPQQVPKNADQEQPTNATLSPVNNANLAAVNNSTLAAANVKTEEKAEDTKTSTVDTEKTESITESWEDIAEPVKESWEEGAEEALAEELKRKEEEENERKKRELQKAEDKKHEEEKLQQAEQKKKEEERLKAQQEEEEVVKKKAEELEQLKEKNLQKGKGNLRSPICCVLGHVDAGKTKLLDKIRKSNVQAGEAGGITQQIGATFFPMKTLQEQTARLNVKYNLQSRIPGLLIIDTPVHAVFSNLRSRGSSLCDIAVLVVDMIEGLKPQTIESIALLRQKKTPFIVAVNKVDRLFGWKENKGWPMRETLKRQEKHVLLEFNERINSIIAQLAGQEFNAALYYKNSDFRTYVSIVPTSATTGEGIPDLLFLLIQLTQNLMANRLLQLTTLQCTVLEVKVTEGFGYTIDVILANGVLNQGDQIVVCGLKGPIVTQIRALLTPQPLKELRIRSVYQHNTIVRAALGLKIAANDLNHAVAGSQLFVVGPEDNLEVVKDRVMETYEKMKGLVSKTEKGVHVQSSTLGALEALLKFLKQEKVPVASISLGPVRKKDITLASTMLEKNCPEYSCILAFDVKISAEMKLIAEKENVKLFESDIIYQLTEQFQKYIEEKRAEIKASATDAIFPCILKIYPEFVFNKRNPILVGVNIVEGTLKLGTPLIIPSQQMLEIGVVGSIEKDNKPQPEAKKGDDVAIKIEHPPSSGQILMYGRQFDHEDLLYSKITRESLNALKIFFEDEVKNKDTFNLLQKMKKVLGIK